VRVLGVARSTRELGGIGIGRGAVVEGEVGRGGAAVTLDALVDMGGGCLLVSGLLEGGSVDVR